MILGKSISGFVLINCVFIHGTAQQVKRDTIKTARSITAINTNNNNTALLNDIVVMYSSMEKDIETMYGKLIAESRNQISEPIDKIKELARKIDSIKKASKLIEAECARLESSGNANTIAARQSLSKTQAIESCQKKLKDNSDRIKYYQSLVKILQARVNELEVSIAKLIADRQKALDELRKQRQR